MKLLSGGQTGVDRAALDVAVARGIAYGGWCPQGGWAEDFPQPPGLLAKYPDLKETPLADPAQRTEWNVRDADACIIMVDAGGMEISAGTTLASELAHRYRKPLLVVNLSRRTFSSRPGSGCASSKQDTATPSSSPLAVRVKARRLAFISAHSRLSTRCWTHRHVVSTADLRALRPLLIWD